MNRSRHLLPVAFLAALALELPNCAAMASSAEDAAHRSLLEATGIDFVCEKYFPVDHERVHEYERGLQKIMPRTAEEERKARGKALIAKIVAEINAVGEKKWCILTRDRLIEADGALRALFPSE